MTDLSEASAKLLESMDDAAPTEAPAEAPAAPEAPAAEPGHTAEEAAPEESRDPVPWGEHKKARDEAARYRTELRAYEDAFAGWAPDDAKALIQAVKVTGQMIGEGRTGDAAKVYAEIAKLLGPDAAEAVQEAAEDAAEDAAEGDDDGDTLMSKAEVQRLLEERDQTREYELGVEREMREIRKTADELGFDPESDEWAHVLNEALSFHDGDVRAAADAVKAREQAAIDKWRASKADTARRTPRVASGANPVPAGEEPPTNIGEASDRLRAFLDTQ